MAKQSLLEELINHIFGRKYYCVLLSRPNIKVKGTGLPAYETSSDIFFSKEEAEEYYERMHDNTKGAIFNSHQIISFRSRENIPEWNMQMEDRVKESGNTLLY